MPTAPLVTPETVIDARHSDLSLGLRDLYGYRDLFLTLAYRDLRVRYTQTFLGLLWAFVQPAATLAIFTLVFDRAIKIKTGVPYPLFALAGLIPWTYFSFTAANAASSLVNAQNMIKKIYFPRLILPLSKAVVGFVDLAVALTLFLALMAYYGQRPQASLLYVPLFLLATVVTALAVGIWLSALTLRYRDFQHVVPFLIQFGLYVTPIGYPAAIIPHDLQAVYFANPMAGVVEGFRWCLVGGPAPSHLVYLSFAIVAVLFVGGLFYFRWVERSMADII